MTVTTNTETVDTSTAAAAVPDAQEAALWAELEKSDAEPGEAPASTETADDKPEPAKEGAAEQKPEPEPDKSAPAPIPYEELDKRYKQLQSALGEARNSRRELADQYRRAVDYIERVASGQLQPAQQQRQAGGQQQGEPPSIDEDPIGHFQYKLAQQERVIAALQQGSQQSIEQLQQERAEEQFWGTVQRSEQEMRASNPDYDPAVHYLEQSRIHELEMMFPDDSPHAQQYATQQNCRSPAELRSRVLNQDRITVAHQALQMGMSPAQLYFQLAQHRGYQSKTGVPSIRKPTAQAANPIDATRAGMKAAKSLSGGGGGTNNAMSADDLAQLYLDDPDKADREFSRMQKAGLLG